MKQSEIRGGGCLKESRISLSLHPGCVLSLYKLISIFIATNGIVIASPRTSRLFRLARIAGQPFEMSASTTVSGAKPSCVTVSFTSLP